MRRSPVVVLKFRSIEAANRYLEQRYWPAFNAEFAMPATEPGAAFVPFIGPDLREILCQHYERTVGAENCVRFDKMILQFPVQRHRCHYGKAKVKASVHRRYPCRIPRAALPGAARRSR